MCTRTISSSTRRATTHYIESTYLPICEKCGEWIPFMVERTEVESEAEPHEYDEKRACAPAAV